MKGACAASSDKLFLCFDTTIGNNPLNSGLKICQISNEPTDSFEVATRSNWEHGTIQIATSESKSLVSYPLFD